MAYLILGTVLIQGYFILAIINENKLSLKIVLFRAFI